MHHPFVAELAEHALALRSLARVLVGEQDADDLVQDVTLQSLQAPPPVATGLRGWLLVVLRRQASNLRRGARRRRHRETATAERTAANAPPTASVAEHQEMARRVTELLLGLPEAYRDVLFRRFFQDATPTQIAAATNVPLATVKSRLQRGLVMLRERLDARSRPDWRPALGTAFGLDRMGAIAPGKLVAGAIMASMGSKLLFTGAAVGLLGLLYLTSSHGDPGLAKGNTSTWSEAGATRAVQAAVPPFGEAPARVAVAASPDVAVVALATIRGRCVDERGKPLAGVQAGWHTKDLAVQDSALAVSRTLTTEGDGAFGFEFDAEARVLWELTLQTEGRVPVRKDVCAIPAGYVVELGDVAMPRGTQVTGRIADRKGRPQAAVELLVGGRRADNRDEFVRHRVETAADGSFAIAENFPAGEFYLQVLERRGITPAQVILDGEKTVEYLDIVVDEVTAPMAVAGVVVDARGQAIAGAEVRVRDEPFEPNEVVVQSDADGRFRLARHPGAPDVVPLLVRRHGYEPMRVDGVAWGRMDLELSLRAGVSVELRATQAVSGAPIEAFEACFLRIEGDTVLSDDSLRVRGRDGVAHLEGVPRGKYRVSVDPAAEELADSQFVPWVVDDYGPQRLEVHLATKVERQIRVQFADGRPVVGSEVELVDPIGHAVDERNKAIGVHQLLHPGQETLWLAAATTDASGMAVVRGPADRPLALLVSGASHLPTAVDRVVFADEPLVVTVRRGATLRGRVLPLEVLLEHATSAGYTPDKPWADFAPGLLFFGGSQLTTPIERDGTFAIDGLAPGTWNVRIELPRLEEGRVARDDWPLATRIDVAADQDTTVDLDVNAFALVETNILVLHNGRPVDSQLVQLFLPTRWPNGELRENFFNAHTDRAGRCQLRLVPGLYSLGYAGPGFGKSIRASERADVRGASCFFTYTMATGTVRLRLRDADGKPARGVPLTFWSETFASEDLRSSESGAVDKVLPVGEYEIRIAAPAGAVLPIGKCSIRMGQATTVEVQLPATPKR